MHDDDDHHHHHHHRHQRRRARCNYAREWRALFPNNIFVFSSCRANVSRVQVGRWEKTLSISRPKIWLTVSTPPIYARGDAGRANKHAQQIPRIRDLSLCVPERGHAAGDVRVTFWKEKNGVTHTIRVVHVVCSVKDIAFDRVATGRRGHETRKSVPPTKKDRRFEIYACTCCDIVRAVE